MEDRDLRQLERLSTALEATRVGIWDWRIDTGETFFDDRYYTMAGYEPGEFHPGADEWTRRLHPDDTARVMQNLDAHLKGQVPAYRVEFRFLCKDGSWLWIAAAGRIVERAADGSPARMIGIHNDISDRKAADELVQSIIRGTEATLGPDFFNALVENMARALGMRYALIGQLEPGDEQRIRTIAVWAGDHLAENLVYDLAKTPCAEVVSGGVCVYPAEVQELFPQDLLLQDMDVEGYIGSPMMDLEGRPLGLIVVLDDGAISKELVSRTLLLLEVFSSRAAAELMRLRAERELRHAQKMDAVGQLAGGIAHDFNNMLGGIMGYAELLSFKLKPGSEMHEYARGIVQAAERAGELTEKLLSFSRKGKRTSLPFDLHGEIEAVVAMLAHTIDRRIRIDRQLEARHSTIDGDPSQVQSAILNLGVNARDAMPDGGELRIRTRNLLIDDATRRREGLDIEPGDYIELMVADTGSGIPREVQERIFDPFFTTKEVGKGTGLGLAAVYGCVRDHRGEVRVSSQPGRGSEFRLLLPLGAVPGIAVEPVDLLTRGYGSVLVVDDEEIVRRMIRATLEDAGYSVLEARDGQEGVTLFRENLGAIGLVMLDMIMPVMDGAQALGVLRELDPDVRVLVMTGFAEGAEVDIERIQGVEGLLRKPFRRQELLNHVTAALPTSTDS